MNTEVEARFRESERELDKSLLAAKFELNDMEIEITDWSGRRYHYQNDKLSWTHWFVNKRPRGSEVEKATVTISMDEDDPAAVAVTTHAEIFQIGKPSRWRASSDEVLPLDEVRRRGLSRIISNGISWAQDAAEGAG